MNAIVFAGPTLPPRLRPAGPWDWRPPVRQGDLYRAALTQPKAIGVVDGYFEVTATVWHKEILWAMARGIHVFGAASIGALRAVELAPFGMQGVGRIYEAFRDGLIEDDDEVAVLHGPEELDYVPLTEAMANMRASFDAAVAAGVLTPSDGLALTAIAKSIFYKNLTYEAVLRAAGESAVVSGAVLETLSAWLASGRVNQKLLDALAMLDAMRSALGAPRLQVSYELAETVAWVFARETIDKTLR